MAEEIIENVIDEPVQPIQPVRNSDILDDTSGAISNVTQGVTTAVVDTTKKFGEKYLGLQPEAVTGVKKTFTEDFVPGSETVSKREVFVDKSKLQPFVKTESIFRRDSPEMVKIVDKMVGFRSKDTQGGGFSEFPENSTYDDKINRMNYMGALQYAYKKKSGEVAYQDIPYETQIAELIEDPEGYVIPSATAIGTKAFAAGGPFSIDSDATTFDKSKDKDQGRFPDWMPFIGGDKVGVTLDKTFGTNFDETGFNLHLARQYNKILIKAGLNPRQRLGIITERLDNKFKSIENIVGYARRGVRFGVETGGYLIGEGFDMLTEATDGIRDSKTRNDFYDLILDKQANILQDGYAARGIDVDIGTAEIIATMFTSTPQRLAAVASEILIPSKIVGSAIVGLSKRELRKWKKFYVKEKFASQNITDEREFVDQAFEKFQAIRNKQAFGGKLTMNVGNIPFGVGATFTKIDSILNGGRLVRGLQIDDAAQTVFKRPEVTAALGTRKNLIKQRDNYLEAVRIRGQTTLADEKQIAKLNNSLNLATENVRSIVLESSLPAFLRDVARGNKHMIIGSASFGQLAQDQNFLGGESDSQMLEAIGLFSGIVYSAGANNRSIASLLKKVHGFTNAGKKDLNFAEELALRVNTFSPEFKVKLENRIQYIDNMQQDLIATNPKLEPLVKLSFAKLSGLAILQGVEEGARVNISEKSIASFGQTIEDLQKVVDLKSSLLNELASASQSISDVRKGGDTPGLLKFQNTLDKAYEFSVKRNDELAQTIEQLKKAHTDEITDAIKGTTGVLDDNLSSGDIGTKLNEMYALNVKNVNWVDEANVAVENQKISDAVDEAIETKAKSLNRTGLLKDAKNNLQKTLNKEDSPTVDYEEFGDLMLSFSENVRNKSSIGVTKEYIKLDTSTFVDGAGNLVGKNAKVEGMGVLEKFIEVIGKNNDTDVLKNLAGANMGKSKQANLFKALDDAAGESVQKHFDTVNINGQYENISEFMESIISNAPEGTIKTFLPRNLQVVDAINQAMKSKGMTIDSIPLSFAQLKEMKQAFSNLGSKYRKLKESGSSGAGNIEYEYNQLKSTTDDMFTKFKVNFGEKDEKLIGNMFVDIAGEKVPVNTLLGNANKAHQTHMSRFFDNKENWSKSFKGRNKVEPNNIRPTGITLDNNPNGWFDFDKISNYNATEINGFQKSFYEFVGSQKGQEFVIDTGTQNGMTLKALMQLKLSDYVAELAKDGKLNSPEYITKLNNLEEIFKVGRKDGKLESLIDVQKVEKDLFGYNPASVKKEVWAKGQRNLKDRLQDLAKLEEAPAVKYLDQRRQVQRILQGISSENTSTKALSQRMFESGPQIKRIKEGLSEFYGNKVSKERIDKLIRDVYLEDLNESVFKTTGRMSFNHKGDLIPEVTMDLEVLKAITGFNSPATRSQVETLIGKKRLKLFDNMIKFCSEESAKVAQSSNITGVPRHFSVESYISRFYSINRGVISARYVGTEAVLQQFRMKGHNMFKALVENPEAGQLFLEIVKTGQPLSRQKEIQFFNVMTQALSYQDKLNNQNPEREIDIPQGWKIKHKEYDKVNLT